MKTREIWAYEYNKEPWHKNNHIHCTWTITMLLPVMTSQVNTTKASSVNYILLTVWLCKTLQPGSLKPRLSIPDFVSRKLRGQNLEHSRDKIWMIVQDLALRDCHMVIVTSIATIASKLKILYPLRSPWECTRSQFLNEGLYTSHGT